MIYLTNSRASVSEEITSILPPFPIGAILKGKNLHLEEKIFSYKKRPHFGRATLSGKKQEVTKVVPLCKQGKQYGGVPIHLTESLFYETVSFHTS